MPNYKRKKHLSTLRNGQRWIHKKISKIKQQIALQKAEKYYPRFSVGLYLIANCRKRNNKIY